MSKTATIAINIGDVSRAAQISRDGACFTDYENPIAGVAGTIRTWVSGTAATVTVVSHAIVNSDLIDIGWTDENGLNKVARRATCNTPTSTTLPFTGAAGDSVPTIETGSSNASVTNGLVTLSSGSFAASCVYKKFNIGGNDYTVSSRIDTTHLQLVDTTLTGITNQSWSLFPIVTVGKRLIGTPFAAVGANVKLLSLYSAPPAGTTLSRAIVDFMASGPTSIKAFDLNSSEPFVWATNSPIANPITGSTVATIEFSSLTTSAPTVYVEVVYDA